MKAETAFTRLSGHQRIAGQLVRSSGGEAIDVWDPATEERIGHIADADAADVDQAVAAANSAQRSWRSVNFHRRGGLRHEGYRRGGGGAGPGGGEMSTPKRGKPQRKFLPKERW